MKKTVLLLIVLVFALSVSAQENRHRFDFKIGTGLGFMGSGDLPALCFENELNYKLNSYLSTSLSLGIGRTPKDIYTHNDYLLGSLNLFISPFKNTGRNNFKIGGGFTLINETSLYDPNVYYDRNNRDFNEGAYNNGFDYLTRMVNGFSVMLEDEYMINSKFLVGGKLFVTGGEKEGGVVSGAMIKLGIVL
ncbi:MAG TPA: hypothetical protein VI413_12185 [Paludibacter sp.]